MPLDALPQTKEQQPELYSISVKEFKVSPFHTELRQYKIGDKITRVNFTDFLTRSFAISMGQKSVQVLFMKWLKLRFGFDYLVTFTNFIKAGGWDSLGNYEKVKFDRSFHKVPRHIRYLEEQELGSENAIRDEILITSEYILSDLSEEDIQDVENINTPNDFLVFAKHEVIRLRKKQQSEED